MFWQWLMDDGIFDSSLPEFCYEYEFSHGEKIFRRQTKRAIGVHGIWQCRQPLSLTEYFTENQISWKSCCAVCAVPRHIGLMTIQDIMTRCLVSGYLKGVQKILSPPYCAQIYSCPIVLTCKVASKKFLVSRPQNFEQ